MMVACFVTYLGIIIYTSLKLAHRLGLHREAELRRYAAEADIAHRIKLAKQWAMLTDEMVKSEARAFAQGYKTGREGSWLVELDKEIGALRRDGECPDGGR
jgi:hypothetical protein